MCIKNSYLSWCHHFVHIEEHDFQLRILGLEIAVAPSDRHWSSFVTDLDADRPRYVDHCFLTILVLHRVTHSPLLEKVSQEDASLPMAGAISSVGRSVC